MASNMIVKEIIGILLLSGSLQILASESVDKSSELSHGFQNEQIKHFKNNDEKFRGASLQFQKDYNRLEAKQPSGHEYKKFKESSDYMKLNEIDSHEYVDKYNKYGNTFNPKTAYMQKEKATYQQKKASENEKHYEALEKPVNLFHDLDVNYVNNPRHLLHDIDVNYINKNKATSEGSELISEDLYTTTAQKSKEKDEENYQNGKEVPMKRFKKKFYQNLDTIDLENPPPPNDTVSMARYIVHTIDWAVLGTISGRSPTKGSPFVCVKATSDGMLNASSGIPFFYLSSLDLCTQDLQKDNRVSVLVTLAQTDYCKQKNLDPQDPRCAKLTLSGKLKRIKPGSAEEKFAKSALFSRHPEMESWPTDHNWYFAKLKIGQIILLDQFGGALYIKVRDYLNTKVEEPDLRK